IALGIRDVRDVVAPRGNSPIADRPIRCGPIESHRSSIIAVEPVVRTGVLVRDSPTRWECHGSNASGYVACVAGSRLVGEAVRRTIGKTDAVDEWKIGKRSYISQVLTLKVRLHAVGSPVHSKCGSSSLWICIRECQGETNIGCGA